MYLFSHHTHTQNWTESNDVETWRLWNKMPSYLYWEKQQKDVYQRGREIGRGFFLFFWILLHPVCYILCFDVDPVVLRITLKEMSKHRAVNEMSTAARMR